MKDFFKQFKENLENRSEPPHEERLWQRLDRDLDNEGKQKPAGFGWWWMLGAFCLILLASNLFSLLELQKVNQQILTLEQKTDTIYLTNVETKIIYQTDTLVQTQIIRDEVVRYTPTLLASNFSSRLEDSKLNQPFWSTSKSRSEIISSSDFELFTYSNLLTKHIHNNKNTNEPLFDNDLSLKDGIVHYTTLDGLPKLDMNSIDNIYPFTTKSTLDQIESTKRKTARQYLYAMRPKGFQLGLSGGWVNLVNDDLERRMGFSAGLNTAVVFSPKLQLWVNASLITADIKSDEFNDTTPAPSEDPPVGSDYQFYTTEADPSFLQYSVGLQYFLNANKKWKPFVGLGYAVEYLLSHDLSYEYQVPADPALEWSTKEHISEQTISDLLLLRAGLEYQISNHWNWQFKADYRFDLKKRNLLAPGLINLQTGLNYQF